MAINPLRKDLIKSLEEGIRKARLALAFGENIDENLEVIKINQENIELLKGEESGLMRNHK